MGKRTVGEGRGSVYAGGRVFVEGDDIPDGVDVGEHVFTDADDDTGNVGLGPNMAAGAHRLVVTEPASEDSGSASGAKRGSKSS